VVFANCLAMLLEKTRWVTEKLHCGSNTKLKPNNKFPEWRDNEMYLYSSLPCDELPSSYQGPVVSGTAGSAAGSDFWKCMPDDKQFLQFFGVMAKTLPWYLWCHYRKRIEVTGVKMIKRVKENMRSHPVDSLTNATYRALFIGVH